MKFLPRLNLFDALSDDFFYEPFASSKTYSSMKTDITEKDGFYTMAIELPGYAKEDIHMDLKDGQLNISASTQQNKEEKDKKGNIVRRERYSGSCSRSFYVGEGVKEEDIKASFVNGELKIILPVGKECSVEQKKFIPIE